MVAASELVPVAVVSAEAPAVVEESVEFVGTLGLPVVGLVEIAVDTEC